MLVVPVVLVVLVVLVALVVLAVLLVLVARGSPLGVAKGMSARITIPREHTQTRILVWVSGLGMFPGNRFVY